MLFARKPRSLTDALLALADSLERHAVEIRQFATSTAPSSPPPAADPLDDMLIDVAHLEADSIG